MTARKSHHFIVGTAGHVDHGKTELVRALTGFETDRLKEEKARGISIELGFAPLDLGDGLFAGIVDVPGHERFVKQMVSGAGGIDMALLLIAADEGVMPQTEEHMEVLRSLRISSGVVVISKSDLGSDETMLLLHDEIEELVRGSFLENAPVVNTSARTGAGIDELKDVLRRLAGELDVRPVTGPFRLAVDRVFHRQGIGVVVTGSCYSGSVRVGDTLELLPGGARIRVRELQSFGSKCAEGGAGQRLAIALQGVKLDDVHRGQMIATAGRFVSTTRFDARITMATYSEFELKNRERLRIHHGAREVLGRVILLEQERMRSGENGLVQFRLESSIVPADEDVIVLRKYSPARVIGGGRVIDPSPERHRRFDRDVLDRIRVRETGDPVRMLRKVLERAGITGVPSAGIDPQAYHVLQSEMVATRIGANVVAVDAVHRLADVVASRVRAHEKQHPLQGGMDKEELRRRVGFDGSGSAWNALLEELCAQRDLFVCGNRVRTGGEDHELDEETRARLDALSTFVHDCGAAFALRADVEKKWNGPEPLGDVIGYLRGHGEIIELAGGGLVHRDTVEYVRTLLGSLFETSDEIGVGDVKTALGLTRKHVIPLLEYFDAIRVTSRRGNTRVRGTACPRP